MSEALAVNNIMITKPRDKADSLPNFLDAKNEEPLRANIGKDTTKLDDQQRTESREETLNDQEDKDLEKFMLVFFTDMNDSSIYSFLEKTFFKDMQNNEATLLKSEKDEKTPTDDVETEDPYEKN